MNQITNHGGKVNLSHVDVILAEVGSIEDYVFSMKHENQQREKERAEQHKARKKHAKGRSLDAPPPVSLQPPKPKAMGRAARILEKKQSKHQQQQGEHTQLGGERKGAIVVKKQQQQQEQQQGSGGKNLIKTSHMRTNDNLKAAMELRKSLGGTEDEKATTVVKKEDGDDDKEEEIKPTTNGSGIPSDDNMQVDEEKRAVVKKEDPNDDENGEEKKPHVSSDGGKRKLEQIYSETAEGSEEKSSGVGVVGDAKSEFDADDGDDNDDDDDNNEIKEGSIIREIDASPEVAKIFATKVKIEQQKKLDEYANAVEDKVRLHESGWKDRYYSDKCKADDVAAHGGREHLFRSYVVGLCWVMKYYYDGCKLLPFFSLFTTNQILT